MFPFMFDTSACPLLTACGLNYASLRAAPLPAHACCSLVPALLCIAVQGDRPGAAAE